MHQKVTYFCSNFELKVTNRFKGSFVNIVAPDLFLLLFIECLRRRRMSLRSFLLPHTTFCFTHRTHASIIFSFAVGCDTSFSSENQETFSNHTPLSNVCQRNINIKGVTGDVSSKRTNLVLKLVIKKIDLEIGGKQHKKVVLHKL